MQISELLKPMLTPPADIRALAATNGSLLENVFANVSVPSLLVDDVANCSGSAINLATADVDFRALQYSLFITVFVEVLGAFFFFATAWYIVEDKAKVDRAIAG